MIVTIARLAQHSQSTMHGAAPVAEQRMPASSIVPVQHSCPPLPRLAQPLPPHSPQPLALFSSTAETTSKEEQVRVRSYAKHRDLITPYHGDEVKHKSRSETEGTPAHHPRCGECRLWNAEERERAPNMLTSIYRSSGSHPQLRTLRLCSRP